MMIDPTKMFELRARHPNFYNDPDEGRVALDDSVITICISTDRQILQSHKQQLEIGPVDERGVWNTHALNKIRKIFPAYDWDINYQFSIEVWDYPQIV